MILDKLDGGHSSNDAHTSAFGVQLDSLADVITFGVAPAAFCAISGRLMTLDDQFIHRAGWLCAFLFLVCAASRLARFNVQTTGATDKRYFTGMRLPPLRRRRVHCVLFSDGFDGSDISPRSLLSS